MLWALRHNHNPCDAMPTTFNHAHNNNKVKKQTFNLEKCKIHNYNSKVKSVEKYNIFQY